MSLVTNARIKRAWRYGFAAILLGGAATAIACGRTPPKAAESSASPLVVAAALDAPLVRAGASQTLLAKIDLSTAFDQSAKRPPVNVALVVDTSGSMEGKAIADARAASLSLLETLSPGDRLSVVAFHSKAETLLPSTLIKDADMKKVRASIEGMKAQGTTAMSEGLRLGLDEVRSHLVAGGVNRVILVGDGVPNDDHAIQSIVHDANASAISITTLGLGPDYDEVLMGRVAQQSGGKFSYIDDSSKVGSFFKEEVVRLHRVVAKNAVLELHPGPGVVVTNVIGRPSSRIDRRLDVLVGDVTAGEKSVFVVELASNPAKDGAAIEALDAVVRWTDETGKSHEDRVFVGAHASNDETAITKAKDPKVTDAAAVARDAENVLRQIESDRAHPPKNGPAPTAAAPVDLASAKPAAKAALLPEPRNADEAKRRHNDALRNFQSY